MKISTLPRVFRRRFAKIGDKGLTLIELLIVITILSILSAIVFFSARDVRSQATTAATSTDAGVVESAQAAYCYANQTYASPMSELYTPPNNELGGPPTYNGSVVWSPQIENSLAGDTTPPSLYGGYRAGGAVYPALGNSAGCNGTNYTPGSLAFQAGTGGPRLLVDPEAMAPVNFLTNSFATDFGGVQLAGYPSSSPTLNDWLQITPNAAVTGAIASRQIATGQLVLMACKSGGVPVAVNTTCQAPGAAFFTGDVNEFTNTASPPAGAFSVNQLAAELAYRVTNAVNCDLTGYNPVLVMEPTSTAFGAAAAAALLAATPSITAVAINTLVADGCIVYGGTATAVHTLMATGGPTVSPSLNTSALPAKYALVSASAAMSPVAVDTDWVSAPSGSNSIYCGAAVPAGFCVAPVATIPYYASIVTPPVTGFNMAQEVQAARFVNYLLSPLGQSTLAEYGFGAGADAANPINEPNP
jgi:prepilin-type N-terminal cleavage/methylation domain-containing protein